MPQFAVNAAVGWKGGAPSVGFDREPVSLWDTVARNFESSRALARVGGQEEAQSAALWKRHRDIEKRTGKTLPAFEMSPDQAAFNMVDTAMPDFSPQAATREDYEAAIDKLRTEAPQAMAGVPMRADVDKAVAQSLFDLKARAGEASEDHPVAGFIGQAAGIMSDPVNVFGTLGTGGIAAGRPLLMRMLGQGLANAGIEGAQAPLRRLEAETVGGPKETLGEVAFNTVTAGLGAAGFEALGHFAGKALRAAAPGTAGKRAAERLAQAADDDLAVGAQDGETFETVTAALARGEAPPPLEPPRDLGEIFQGGEAGTMQPAEYRGRPIYAGRFEPGQVGTDAATFQYKADGDAEGVTARLRGIEAWDATASGKVIVYEASDGTRTIADGHQRRGLALRMQEKGWDAQLDGYLFREADGWSAPQVRVVAALKNIREGSGAILDAAKVFRDAPAALDDASLPVSGDFIGRARALARLSDEAFGAVINGAVPERWGADIGLLAGNRPDLHAGMVRLLKTADPANADEAQALIVGALQDDWIKTQGDQIDLFGHDPAESALIARAKVAAAVKRTLASDARLFGQLVKNADAIEAGGNALARDTNEASVAVNRAALEVTARLAMRAGPVGEAMAEAAGKVARGEMTAAQAAKGVSKAVREALEAGERFDEARASLIAPEAPSAAARAMADGFDDAAGPAGQAQVKDAPEDAATPAGEKFTVTTLAGSRDGIDRPSFTIIPASEKIQQTPTDGLTGMHGTMRGDAWIIRASGLPTEYRGQGLGVAMYEEAVQAAGAAGKRLESDTTVSAQAAQVWDALKRRGYPVERDAAAVLEDGPNGGWYAEGRPVYRTTEPAKPKAASKPPGAGEPVAKLTGEEIAPAATPIKDLRTKAAEWFKTKLRGTSVDSQALGKPVKFESSRKAISDSANPDKLRLFAALPEMIAKGRLIGSEPPLKGGENIKAFHYLEAFVELNGEPRRVTLSVREQTDGALYYNHVVRGGGSSGEGAVNGPGEPGSWSTPPSEGGTGQPGRGAAPDDIGPDGDGINLTVEAAEEAPQPGLFDDLAPTSWHEAAATHLKPCVPE